jgi:hypothetical protein
VSGKVLPFPNARLALVEVDRHPDRDQVLELAAALRTVAPAEVSDADVADLAIAATNLGFVLGGLMQAPSPGAAPKHLVSDGERFVWSELPGGGRQAQARPAPVVRRRDPARLIDVVQEARPLVAWQPTRLRFFFDWSFRLGR